MKRFIKAVVLHCFGDKWSANLQGSKELVYIRPEDIVFPAHQRLHRGQHVSLRLTGKKTGGLYLTSEVSVSPLIAVPERDWRLRLLFVILKEGRIPTKEEFSKLHAEEFLNIQKQPLYSEYSCADCGERSDESYDFRDFYAVTFGADQPAVVLCQHCQQRFFQLFPESEADIPSFSDAIRQLGGKMKSRGWSVSDAVKANGHTGPKQEKVIPKGSLQARQQNAELVEELSERWASGERKTA